MLTDSNRLTLTEGKRSDNRLFDFYSKLAVGGVWADLPLPEQIQKAREEFGKPPDGHVPLFQLTISHKHRMSLIRAAQKEETKAARLAGEDVIWLPPVVSSCQNKTQGLYLFRGKLLIAVATAKGVYNSQLLRCTALGPGACEFADAETGATMTLTNATIQKHLRSARAMTFASVQGRGFEEVGIHTSSAKFTKKHLFMALSRAKSSHKLWIMD